MFIAGLEMLLIRRKRLLSCKRDIEERPKACHLVNCPHTEALLAKCYVMRLFGANAIIIECLDPLGYGRLAITSLFISKPPGFAGDDPAEISTDLGAFRGSSLFGNMEEIYNHPEVDRIWGIDGISHGPFKDHILSTRGVVSGPAAHNESKQEVAWKASVATKTLSQALRMGHLSANLLLLMIEIPHSLV